MWAIYKREITSFFASPIAYLIIGIFLVINGLFLWVFQGSFNIFDYGFADLSNFFLLAPWILLLLIPAICMKSFSEEMRSGTLELLYISPSSIWQMVLAKFFAAITLATIAILPTLLYIYSLAELGTTVGNVDLGLALGSYIGLLFLITTYTGISLFTSPLLMPILQLLALKIDLRRLKKYKRQFLARQKPGASLICHHAPVVILYHAPVSSYSLAGADALAPE